MADGFGFRMCWTCRHLVLDIEGGNRTPSCSLKGHRMSRKDSVTPTACPDWHQDITETTRK